MKAKSVIALVFLAAVIGGGGFWLGQTFAPTHGAATAEDGREPLYYRHPMNPEVTSPVPAKDNMGMDYVPVYADGAAGKGDEPAGTVTIDPVMVQNIGVRTAKAERRELSADVFTVGRVEYDEDNLTRLHPKVEGWIEELYVEQTGSAVKRGTRLLSIYSPQLVATQEEYLLALKNLKTLQDSPYEDIRRGAEQLVRSARRRLQLLDMPAHQLRELEESGKAKRNLHIHSPFDGIAVKVGVRDGQYISPQTELFQLADLSTVWVDADIYEHEIPWVQQGDPAELKLAALPGRTFTGQVDYIYPYLDPKTRTQKLRLEFDNRDLALKPNMFADVTIRTRRQVDAVVIPEQAVIRSGRREQVFVQRAPGKFEPREVQLGLRAEGLVQVLDGVQPGEEVVTSSQFLIDSESKLREAADKMRPVQQSHSSH